MDMMMLIFEVCGLVVWYGKVEVLYGVVIKVGVG